MSFFSQSPPVASTHTLGYVWPWKTSLPGRDGRGKEVAPLDCHTTLSCTRMTAQSWSRGWPALAEQREIAMHFLSWSAIKAAASSHSMVTSWLSFCWIKAQIWIRAQVETPDRRHCNACSTLCPLPDPPGVPLPLMLRMPYAGSSLFRQSAYSVLGWAYVATVLWLLIVLHYVDLKITFLWLLPSWWPGVRWAKGTIWNPRP